MNKILKNLLLSSFAVVSLSGCGGERADEVEVVDISEGLEVAEDAGSYEGNASRSDISSENKGYVSEFFENPKHSIPVNFDFDSSKVNESYMGNLNDLVVLMNKVPGLNIALEGHCDSRGTKAYNLGLGLRRAAAVKNFLISRGISADRINTVSFGKEKPIMFGENPGAWAKNRRVEVKVL